MDLFQILRVEDSLQVVFNETALNTCLSPHRTQLPL